MVNVTLSNEGFKIKTAHERRAEQLAKEERISSDRAMVYAKIIEKVMDEKPYNSTWKIKTLTMDNGAKILLNELSVDVLVELIILYRKAGYTVRFYCEEKEECMEISFPR